MRKDQEKGCVTSYSAGIERATYERRSQRLAFLRAPAHSKNAEAAGGTSEFKSVGSRDAGGATCAHGSSEDWLQL